MLPASLADFVLLHSKSTYQEPLFFGIGYHQTPSGWPWFSVLTTLCCLPGPFGSFSPPFTYENGPFIQIYLIQPLEFSISFLTKFDRGSKVQTESWENATTVQWREIQGLNIPGIV